MAWPHVEYETEQIMKEFHGEEQVSDAFNPRMPSQQLGMPNVRMVTKLVKLVITLSQ